MKRKKYLEHLRSLSVSDLNKLAQDELEVIDSAKLNIRLGKESNNQIISNSKIKRAQILTVLNQVGDKNDNN